MRDAYGAELKIGQLVEILDLTLDDEGVADLEGLEDMIQFVGQQARVWYVGPVDDSVVQLELPGVDGSRPPIPYRGYGWAGNWVAVVPSEGLKGLVQRYQEQSRA